MQKRNVTVSLHVEGQAPIVEFNIFTGPVDKPLVEAANTQETVFANRQCKSCENTIDNKGMVENNGNSQFFHFLPISDVFVTILLHIHLIDRYLS